MTSREPITNLPQLEVNPSVKKELNWQAALKDSRRRGWIVLLAGRERQPGSIGTPRASGAGIRKKLWMTADRAEPEPEPEPEPSEEAVDCRTGWVFLNDGSAASKRRTVD